MVFPVRFQKKRFENFSSVNRENNNDLNILIKNTLTGEFTKTASKKYALLLNILKNWEGQKNE